MRADGYHLIDAEMVSLSLHDVVTIDPAGDGVSATGRYASGVPTDDRNLVAKALWLVERRAHVTVDKRIPHGGGLGGGSSDAAAVLRWAGFDDARSPPPSSAPTCRSAWSAAAPGSAASVRSWNRCRSSTSYVTLVVPPLAVSTAAAYRAWDELGGPTADGPNDLEPAAIRVEPELAAWRDRIGDASGETPVLAGQRRHVVGARRTRRRPRRIERRGRRDRGRADRPWRARLRGGSSAAGLTRAICDAGGGYGEASSCASSCASACGAS